MGWPDRLAGPRSEVAWGVDQVRPGVDGPVNSPLASRDVAGGGPDDRSLTNFVWGRRGLAGPCSENLRELMKSVRGPVSSRVAGGGRAAG